MGFWDFLKKAFGDNTEEREFLMQWQNDVLTNKTDSLIMTEQQLIATTIQTVQNDYRILVDSSELVQKTNKPDVFFMRLQLMIEKVESLCKLERYFKRSGITFNGVQVQEMREDILQKYDEATRLFLVRYFTATLDKVDEMKTEKGKLGKIQKFYDSLQEYYSLMSEENIEYVETKYKAYTRQRK